MTSALLFLEGNPPKVVIMVDDTSLPLLKDAIKSLRGSGAAEVRLSQIPLFEIVNMEDLIFRKSDRSHANVSPTLVTILTDEKHIKEYLDLLDGLGCPAEPVGARDDALTALRPMPHGGHQYLDTDSDEGVDADILVSKGEYESTLKAVQEEMERNCGKLC